MAYQELVNAKASLSAWQGSYSEGDFARLAHVAQVHGHGSTTDALRFCLREQSRRDVAFAEGAVCVRQPTPGIYARATQSCRAMRNWKRANQHGASSAEARSVNASRPALRRWSCLLGPSDRANVARILKAHSLDKQAEAVRFAIFVQSELDGYKGS